MTDAEFKALREKLLHRSRYSFQEQTVLLEQLVAEAVRLRALVAAKGA